MESEKRATAVSDTSTDSEPDESHVASASTHQEPNTRKTLLVNDGTEVGVRHTVVDYSSTDEGSTSDEENSATGKVTFAHTDSLRHVGSMEKEHEKNGHQTGTYHKRALKERQPTPATTALFLSIMNAGRANHILDEEEIEEERYKNLIQTATSIQDLGNIVADFPTIPTSVSPGSFAGTYIADLIKNRKPYLNIPSAYGIRTMYKSLLQTEEQEKLTVSSSEPTTANTNADGSKFKPGRQ